MNDFKFDSNYKFYVGDVIKIQSLSESNIAVVINDNMSFITKLKLIIKIIRMRKRK